MRLLVTGVELPHLHPHPDSRVAELRKLKLTEDRRFASSGIRADTALRRIRTARLASSSTPSWRFTDWPRRGSSRIGRSAPSFDAERDLLCYEEETDMEGNQVWPEPYQLDGKQLADFGSELV